MKKYCIITLWSYPFGGGEKYMYDTLKWSKELGYKNYWISFMKANQEVYQDTIIENNDLCTFIKIENGFDTKSLLYWLKFIRPDIIHHQGHMRNEILKITTELRIQTITGYHFWNGFLNIKNNVNIKNQNCSISDDFIKLSKNKFVSQYVVSDFMRDLVKHVLPNTRVLYPIPLEEDNIGKKNKREYITQVNIHKMKGGEVLLNLIKHNPEEKFICIRTEFLSESLDKEIKKLLNEDSLFLPYQTDMSVIYSKTKLLLIPSLVDETFCRTAIEGMMNGIPIITTGNGNLSYLLKDCGIIEPDLTKWNDIITNLDQDKLNELSSKSLEVYNELYNENMHRHIFQKYLKSHYDKGKRNNIMIMVPWCDQGLGIQGRNYMNVLLKHGYEVFIFSYKPYNAKSALDLQNNQNEWIFENVYYSNNDREHITDKEIEEFIKTNNIGKCIIPETCWFRIFEIGKLLRKLDVKTFAIPNIEIVRRSELAKHTNFDRILCNNKLCQNVFEKYGFKNTSFIGYSLTGDFNKQIKKKNKIIKFLCIGGMNAFTRKNVYEVCQSFMIALEKNQNIELTVTVQKYYDERMTQFENNPNIIIINKALAYDEINKLYLDTDIVVHVSKHEGLGIGFYEALKYNKPIITLNTEPHNEIVNKTNGWYVNCKKVPMTDNPESFIESAIFNPKELGNLIVDIVKHKKHINEKSMNITKNNKTIQSNFYKNFIDALEFI